MTHAAKSILLTITLAIAWLPGIARAQVTVTAALSDKQVYVGEGLQLNIEVNGATNPQQPSIPEVPDLVLQFQGGQDVSRRSIMIINGRRTEDKFVGYVFNYTVIANQPGRHIIPPLTVVVDGREYTTQQLTFTAVAPGQDANHRLVLEADKLDAYVGEPVRVRLTWYLSGSPRVTDFTAPPSAGYEFFPPSSPTENDGQQFTFLQKPAVAVSGEGELDGRRYTTLTVDRIFVARQTGKVTVGPIRLIFTVPSGRGLFASAERKVIASNPLEFNIKPLPQPQPPNFRGLINKHTVDARLSSTSFNVGDPITLTVLLQGPEPLDAVGPLDFSRLPSLRNKFRLPGEPAVPTLAKANGKPVAVFTTTIRAESDQITEFPPIEFAYFDPATGRYETARSAPIPLAVKRTTDVVLPADLDDPRTSEQRTESVGGLAPIVTSQDLLTKREFDLFATLRSPTGIAVLGAPAAVYLSCLGVVALRRQSEKDPARRRRRGAQGRALRSLARAGRRAPDAAEIGAALRGFVADWFNIPEGGITSAECAAQLAAAGIPSASNAAEVLDRCDAALYGGGSALVTVAEAQDCVRTLARELEGNA